MIEAIGHFIGRRLADAVNFFQGRQAVPCLVDWDVIEVIQRPDFTMDSEGDCKTCDEDCCMLTDTIGEFQGKE